MAEGPLKVGKIGTSEFLKQAGVRETTLPAMDLGRVATASAHIGDYSGLVPGLHRTVVAGTASAGWPVLAFSMTVRILAAGNGLWIREMTCDIANAYLWLGTSQAPVAFSNSIALAVGAGIYTNRTPEVFESEIRLGDVAASPGPDRVYVLRHNAGMVTDIFLPPGKALFAANPNAAQAWGFGVVMDEIPSKLVEL